MNTYIIFSCGYLLQESPKLLREELLEKLLEELPEKLPEKLPEELPEELSEELSEELPEVILGERVNFYTFVIILYDLKYF
jgi:hypothetical protein